MGHGMEVSSAMVAIEYWIRFVMKLLLLGISIYTVLVIAVFLIGNWIKLVERNR